MKNGKLNFFCYVQNVCVVLALVSGLPVRVYAQPADAAHAARSATDDVDPVWEYIGKRTSAKGVLAGLVTLTRPQENNANPRNQVKRISQLSLNERAGTDFSLTDRSIGLFAKLSPRWTLGHDYTDAGHPQAEVRRGQEAYINNYFLQWQPPGEDVTVTLLRRNLDWGPSFLRSPSNLFVSKQSNQNPLYEVRGKDYAQATIAPWANGAATLIYNYGKGATTDQGVLDKGFPQAAALTYEHYFPDKYVRLIGGWHEENGALVGSYGQWTYNESTIFYYDAGITFKSLDYYPVIENGSPFGGTYKRIYETNSRVLPSFVVGASYTTESNYVFNLDYFYHGPGYDGENIRAWRSINKTSAAQVRNNNPLLRSGALGTLGLGASNSDGYLGQHYLGLQVSSTFLDNIDIVAHDEIALQDGSQLLFVSATTSYGKGTFSVSAVMTTGGAGSVSGKDIDKQITIGYRLTF